MVDDPVLLPIGARPQRRRVGGEPAQGASTR